MPRKLVVTVFSLALAAGLPVAASAEEGAAGLDEILEGYYAAIGGIEEWNAVESLRLSGNMMIGPGMESPFTLTQKRPEKLRLEFEVQGMTGVQAYDGETGWMYLPFMGKTEAEVMPEDTLEQFMQQADIEGPLVNWADKGHAVDYVGEADLEGTPTYEIKVTLAGGDERFFYLDKEAFVPLAMKGTTEAQGTTTDFEVLFSDYDEVEGLVMPLSIEQRAAGAPSGQVITIDTVEVGVEIDDASFMMPEPDQEAEAAE